MYINHITRLISPELTPLSVMSEKYSWGNRNDKIFSRFHNFVSASLFPETALPVLIENLFCQLSQECDQALLEKIDFIAWAHSLHAVLPFDINKMVQNQFSRIFNNPNVEFFSITQGSCASGILTLKYIQSKFSTQKWCSGLMITGEKCFHQTVQFVDQNGYFGEGLSATLIGVNPSPSALKIKAIRIAQLGVFGKRTRETTRDHENHYDREFLPAMQKTIELSLSDADCRASELSILLPYHISPVTFDRLADRTGFSRDIIYKKNIYTLGHCFCSDAFINLHDLVLQSGAELKGKSILSLASGVAGTFAAMIIESEAGVIE